jgi:hypothetical protein
MASALTVLLLFLIQAISLRHYLSRASLAAACNGCRHRRIGAAGKPRPTPEPASCDWRFEHMGVFRDPLVLLLVATAVAVTFFLLVMFG